MTRTDLLPMFAPPDYLAALDLLDPVAPGPVMDRVEKLDRTHRLESFRRRRRDMERRGRP